MKPALKHLESGDISLRIFSPEDGAAIYGAVQQSLPELKRFMFWAHHTGDLKMACELYARFNAKSLNGEEAHYAGFDSKSGECLFAASLIPGSRLNPLALELGYWVASKHAGRGLGTQAARLMLSLAFGHFGADRVSVSCHKKNFASLRVIEKCGFKMEGELRNFLIQPTPKMIQEGYEEGRTALLFSLLPEEWSYFCI